MKKSLMKKQNWLISIGGILLTYLGFFLASFITTNYDGIYAFFTMAVLISGLVVVVVGLSLRFESSEDNKEA